MLLLLLRVAGDRFALPARQVVEVLPDLPLEPATGLGPACPGVLAWRGRAVPVLDLGLCLAGRPAPRRLSTRLILVREGEGRGEGEVWALRAEGVTGTLRVDQRFSRRGRGPLGEVLFGPDGALRLLDPAPLLGGLRQGMGAVALPAPPQAPPAPEPAAGEAVPGEVRGGARNGREAAR